MKNKAGTAAGNPRARADRASPTMNGNPNAQVRPICFDVHLHHHDHRHVCINSFYSLSPSPSVCTTTCSSSSFHHFFMVALPALFSALVGLARRCWCCARCRGGCQPSFGFWPSGPGPGPAQVQLQWQAPQRLIRHCRPPLVRCGRVIPAHLIHWTQRHAFPASMSHNCL